MEIVHLFFKNSVYRYVNWLFNIFVISGNGISIPIKINASSYTVLLLSRPGATYTRWGRFFKVCLCDFPNLKLKTTAFSNVFRKSYITHHSFYF